METILERIETRLDGMSKKLDRLEVQNEILRKELHGIRSYSTPEDFFALMEAKTLREVVEEIQFDVKTINAKLGFIESHRDDNSVNKKKSNRSSNVFDKKESSGDESDVEFQKVEIRSKTLEEENDWLKEKYHELRSRAVIENGVSFHGMNIETMLHSIPILGENGTSCMVKLTNHLNYALTDPTFYFLDETKMTGPSVIAGHCSEVFLGSGQSCGFLCSLSISSSLRIAFFCQNRLESYIYDMSFYVAFIPHDVPTDSALNGKLSHMPATSDFCKKNMEAWYKPIEFLATTGQFLVRGHMESSTATYSCVVQIEIFEMIEQPANCSLSIKYKNLAPNPKRALDQISRSMKRSQGCHSQDIKISCSVEIFNLLNVTLRNRESFYCESRRHNYYISHEVPPCQGVAFSASDDKNVEGMFSYEIESTDLCLIVGFRVGGSDNSFAGAFMPLPTPANKQE